MAQRDGGPFAELTGDASKSAEQAARIAGVIALFEDPNVEEIGAETTARAVAIARWFLYEALRLFDVAAIDGTAANARDLWAWISRRDRKLKDGQLSPRYVTRTGLLQNATPKRLRKKAALDPALDELLERRLLRSVPNVRIGGVCVPKAYEVREGLNASRAKGASSASPQLAPLAQLAPPPF